MKTEITDITAREILDSRGNPTVEATVHLANGVSASASVPSGASTGRYEACELRDETEARFFHRGVLRATKNVTQTIAPALIGMDATEQSRADAVMIALDGTSNKSNLGANAILSVSMALARAAARSVGIPLYRYLGGSCLDALPPPMMNVLNGGAHASNNIDIQEFMIVPIGASCFSEGVRMCAEIYHSLRDILKEKALVVAVGDEGGFAPMAERDEEAIEWILAAIDRAGYQGGRDVMIALDIAGSEWASHDGYTLPKRGVTYTADELCAYYETLCRRYPILSIEDGMGEDDANGWRALTARLGDRTMLVGDDLFVTNADRLRTGIEGGLANAILIKPNQIGTITETHATVRMAKQNGYRVVFSHRSGETEDDFLADLSVAFHADWIKSGAPARSERLSKYNRLMKIEQELFSPVYGQTPRF